MASKDILGVSVKYSYKAVEKFPTSNTPDLVPPGVQTLNFYLGANLCILGNYSQSLMFC